MLAISGQRGNFVHIANCPVSKSVNFSILGQEGTSFYSDSAYDAGSISSKACASFLMACFEVVGDNDELGVGDLAGKADDDDSSGSGSDDEFAQSWLQRIHASVVHFRLRKHTAL